MEKKIFTLTKMASLCAILISLMIFSGSALGDEKKEIVFGFSVPLTGALEYAGVPSKNGYEAWASMVNAEGGIYVKEYGKKLPVRLVYYDDKTDPTVAAKIYEKLITQDKVDFLLSPWGSSIGFAVSQIAQKYKKPIIFVWISSDPIYKQGYEYVFGVIEPATRHAWSAVKVLMDKKLMNNEPPKKLFFVTAKELYPKTADNGAMEFAKANGFETYYEEVEKGCKDFTPVITRMKEAGIEAVITSMYYEDFFTMYRQIQELGFKPKYIYAAHSDLPDFAETFGAATVEGVCAHGFWGTSWNTFENQQFVAAYKDKWGQEPNQWAITVSSAQVLKEAIEKAGTLDNEKVKDALREGEYKCMLGSVKYINDGDYTNLNSLAATGLLQWQNGKLVFVYPEEISEAKFIYPIRWDR